MSFISDRPSSFHDVSKMVSKPSRVASEVGSNARSGVISSCVRASSFPFSAAEQEFSPRVPDMAAALYGLPYGDHAPASHLHAGSSAFDPLAIYSALNYMDPKDTPYNWRSMHPHLEAYDTSMASLLYQGVYPPLMLADRMPRKNATKETTATLKKWLNEHMKNPYPTKTEKIMLAMISKMTLTQVSTWFANARRRLKKENKMTWSPRNRCGEDKESDDDDEKETDHASPIHLVNHPGTLSPGSNHNDDVSSPKSDVNQNRRLSFHHYQQQMLLRQIAAISPRFHTPEALRHHHEKLMLCSPWKEEPVSNGVKSASFVFPDKVGMGLWSQQNVPSSSRHPAKFRNHSASPAVTQPHLEKSFVSNQLHSETGDVKSSTSKSDPTSQPNKSNQGVPKRHKSIWSPVNMTDDKAKSDKLTSSDVAISSQRSLSSPQSSSCSLGSVSDRKSRISVDSEVSAASCLSPLAEDSASPLPPSVYSRNKLHPGEFIAHQSLISQQLLAARFASFNSGRNPFLSHNYLLEQPNPFYPSRSHTSIPQLTSENIRPQEEKSAQSSSYGDDDNHSDQEPNTPMNLSNRGKEQEGDTPIMTITIGQENRTSVAAK